MEQAAWSSAARPLVLLHAALSIVLIGATTHHLVATYGLFRGRQPRPLRIHAGAVAVTYVLTTIVGAMAYPMYRYHVRALFLDRHAPWASNLFDIKENLATIGLPLALAAWWMGRSFSAGEDRDMRFGYAIMVALVTGIVWFNVVSGLLVTMVRGV